MKKVLTLLLFIFLFILFSISAEPDYWKGAKYADVLAKLKQAGFSEIEIDSIFSDSRVKFYSSITKKFKTAKIPKLADPSSELLSKKSIDKGKEFIKKNKELLERVEKEYGIGKEIIVAILRVESNLGQSTGSYQTFSVFNSIIFYTKTDLGRNKWAKKQMVAFLTICRTLGINPFEIKGSWAGAIGILQFLPTSYLAFGIDGNKDGKIDLFDLEDAVYSVVNYLIKHGWKKDRPKAIYAYNHSWNYARGVEAYAKKLRN